MTKIIDNILFPKIKCTRSNDQYQWYQANINTLTCVEEWSFVIFGKLYWNFFIMDMVAFMQGGIGPIASTPEISLQHHLVAYRISYVINFILNSRKYHSQVKVYIIWYGLKDKIGQSRACCQNDYKNTSKV